ncbi:hypothetical protein CDAR_487631 [Caerostris darwini]|uniref:Uncharacterized protein n=1 Tax=Caerostris darwini TaxID=1538125 RepID=A0AAV4PRG5_9ARAC|nr:hypothetical protein CDAR_487631 [Caerostris darwini]
MHFLHQDRKSSFVTKAPPCDETDVVRAFSSRFGPFPIKACFSMYYVTIHYNHNKIKFNPRPRVKHSRSRTLRRGGREREELSPVFHLRRKSEEIKDKKKRKKKVFEGKKTGKKRNLKDKSFS